MPKTISDWRQAFRDADMLPSHATPAEKAARGRAFEKILDAMFEEANLRPRLNYRPVGEEVDGSIWLDGRTILIEAKWTGDAHPASSLYQFKGKVDGKLVGTIGLFISMAGFSPDAVNALVAGKELNVILVDGNDVRALVDSQISVRSGLRKKIRAAGDTGAPLVPLHAFAKPIHAVVRRSLVIVEGAADVMYLTAIQRIFGAPRDAPRVVAAGGLSNVLPLVESLLDDRGYQSIVLIVNSDSDPRMLRNLGLNLSELSGEHGADSRLVVVNPDIEAALGVSEGNVSLGGRRGSLSPEELSALLNPSMVRHRASNNQSLRRVFDEIGIPPWG